MENCVQTSLKFVTVLFLKAETEMLVMIQHAWGNNLHFFHLNSLTGGLNVPYSTLASCCLFYILVVWSKCNL